MEDAMGTALTGIGADIIAGLTTVAPIAIGIVGAFLVWKYGVSFFKKLVG